MPRGLPCQWHPGGRAGGRAGRRAGGRAGARPQPPPLPRPPLAPQAACSSQAAAALCTQGSGSSSTPRTASPAWLPPSPATRRAPAARCARSRVQGGERATQGSEPYMPVLSSCLAACTQTITAGRDRAKNSTRPEGRRPLRTASRRQERRELRSAQQNRCRRRRPNPTAHQGQRLAGRGLARSWAPLVPAHVPQNFRSGAQRVPAEQVAPPG